MKRAAAALIGAAAATVLVSCRSSAPDAGPVAAATRVAAAPTAAASPSAGTAAATTAPPARDRPAAAGGVAILASSVRAEAVVVGVVGAVAAVDAHGWRADLRVDQVLRGDLVLGQTITIGWEELSASRRVRFGDGARVLVVLDPVPTQSLWRQRFPTRDPAHPVLVVAAAGDAFLTSPDGPTIDGLEHYLALAPPARAGGPGAVRLAELVGAATPSVGREALALLEGDSTLASALGVDGGAALLAAVRRVDRPLPFRAAVLLLAARQHVAGTRETARALVETDAPLRADAYRALAVLDGGLASADVERLLRDPDPALRLVAIEVAGDQVGRERERVLMRDDAAPAVRLAAGRAILARRDDGGGIGDVVAALDDADPTVRNGIAEAIGALGQPAVGPLSAVVDDGSERAALAAVLGLSGTGKPGGVMLASIAQGHRYPSVQAFARLALGEAPGHGHKD